MDDPGGEFREPPDLNCLSRKRKIVSG